MASLFAHGFVAATGGALLTLPKQRGWILLLGALAAIFPDIDVLAFYYGIPYHHPWGHRGATHSLAFAVLFGLLLSLCFARSYRPFSKAGLLLWAYFALATTSHGVCDAITNGGLGVAFLYPFDNTRYFFPDEWRFVQVSPIGAARFFSERGLRVILSELRYIAIPWLAFVMLVAGLRLLVGSFRRRNPD